MKTDVRQFDLVKVSLSVSETDFRINWRIHWRIFPLGLLTGPITSCRIILKRANRPQSGDTGRMPTTHPLGVIHGLQDGEVQCLQRCQDIFVVSHVVSEIIWAPRIAQDSGPREGIRENKGDHFKNPVAAHSYEASRFVHSEP